MTAAPCRLSVIVPFHSEPAFVDMAIGSVLGQGLDNVEILMVNDNPQTYAPDWFEQLNLPDSVRLIHNPQNLGLSATRNVALDVARGTHVAFLDADDFYLSGGLAAQLALAVKSGACITHAQACRSHIGNAQLRLVPRDGLLFGAERTAAGLLGMEEAQFFVSSWSSIYRRDFLQGNGLQFDAEQVRFEDRLFVLQTVTAASRIACLGRPVRVWRQRTGSISSTPPDYTTHRLQVQLLEKCMAHMSQHASTRTLPVRFLKRELFNTISRLIWDVGLLDLLAQPPDQDYADLGRRVSALLGSESFGQQIFDDPVLRPISRVGQRTRQGLIRRADFFALHRAMRTGDHAQAAALLAERQAEVAPRVAVRARAGRRLILHLGMHKTGSTHIQSNLVAHAGALRRAGVLFAETGRSATNFNAVRPQGLPGHLGLLHAARDDDDAMFAALAQEITRSGCETVLLSCENMLMPLADPRPEALAKLFARLASFADVVPIAFVRRPDRAPEMFYRELVCNGHPAGACTPDAFLVDHADRLTDLANLFAPFEAFAGRPVALADYDRAAAQETLWAAFLGLAGLGHMLPVLPETSAARTYPTPGRDHVNVARLVTSLVQSETTRTQVLREFFADTRPGATGGPDVSLLSPGTRLALIDRFQASSALFCSARGYAPDLSVFRSALGDEIANGQWQPPEALPMDLLQRAYNARQRVDELGPRAALNWQERRPDPTGYTIRIRPRPWLTGLIDRINTRLR